MKNNCYQEKVDKTLIEISTLKDNVNDKDYWMSKTSDERFAVLEILRSLIYGYDESTGRFQRVISFAK